MALTDRERENIINRINAMNDEELQVVVNSIPVGMCLQRIADELGKSVQLAENISNCIEQFKR